MDTADLLGFDDDTPNTSYDAAPTAAATPSTTENVATNQTADLLGGGFDLSISDSSSPQQSPKKQDTVQQNSPTTVAGVQSDVDDLLSGAPPAKKLFDSDNENKEKEQPEAKSTAEEAWESSASEEVAKPDAAAVAAQAPALAGMSKITRTSTQSPTKSKEQQKRRPRIIVPMRAIGMGDLKFEADPTKTNLCDLLAPHEYRTVVNTINDALKEVRATNVDKALMATAPLVVPLAVFGKRQNKRSRERKMVLHDEILRFNEEYPTLRMMWNKSPAGDYLCIVERDGSMDVPIAVNQQLPTGLE